MGATLSKERRMLLPIFIGLLASASDASTGRPTDFAVAAYLPEWRYEGANWDTISQHVSHLILFSLEVTDVGGIGALDRIPRPELLAQAKEAAARHGTQLLICFGGNGRSEGFSSMVRSDTKRASFVRELVALCDKYGFDGVDYNWEYPGYAFGRGYLPEPEIKADYKGLFSLFRDTHAAFASGRQRSITMSYYPDQRQEALLKEGRAAKWVDYMFSMSYDQTGKHHSSLEFGKTTVTQMVDAKLPARKMCLGLPFYGRSFKTGDWKSYEDLVQKYAPLAHTADSVGGQGFNGRHTIAAKTKHAIESGIGGVMIWEVGQDCRIEEITHGSTTHVVTCPDGERSSLLVAITDTMAEMKRTKPAFSSREHSEL